MSEVCNFDDAENEQNKKRKRSSILKPPRMPLEELDPTSTLTEQQFKKSKTQARRVSFADTHEIKQFVKGGCLEEKDSLEGTIDVSVSEVLTVSEPFRGKDNRSSKLMKKKKHQKRSLDAEQSDRSSSEVPQAQANPDVFSLSKNDSGLKEIYNTTANANPESDISTEAQSAWETTHIFEEMGADMEETSIVTHSEEEMNFPYPQVQNLEVNGSKHIFEINSTEMMERIQVIDIQEQKYPVSFQGSAYESQSSRVAPDMSFTEAVGKIKSPYAELVDTSKENQNCPTPNLPNVDGNISKGMSEMSFTGVVGKQILGTSNYPLPNLGGNALKRVPEIVFTREENLVISSSYFPNLECNISKGTSEMSLTGVVGKECLAKSVNTFDQENNAILQSNIGLDATGHTSKMSFTETFGKNLISFGQESLQGEMEAVQQDDTKQRLMLSDLACSLQPSATESTLGLINVPEMDTTTYFEDQDVNGELSLCNSLMGSSESDNLVGSPSFPARKMHSEHVCTANSLEDQFLPGSIIFSVRTADCRKQGTCHETQGTEPENVALAGSLVTSTLYKSHDESKINAIVSSGESQPRYQVASAANETRLMEETCAQGNLITVCDMASKLEMCASVHLGNEISDPNTSAMVLDESLFCPEALPVLGDVHDGARSVRSENTAISAKTIDEVNLMEFSRVSVETDGYQNLAAGHGMQTSDEKIVEHASSSCFPIHEGASNFEYERLGEGNMNQATIQRDLTKQSTLASTKASNATMSLSYEQDSSPQMSVKHPEETVKCPIVESDASTKIQRGLAKTSVILPVNSQITQDLETRNTLSGSDITALSSKYTGLLHLKSVVNKEACTSDMMDTVTNIHSSQSMINVTHRIFTPVHPPSDAHMDTIFQQSRSILPEVGSSTTKITHMQKRREPILVPHGSHAKPNVRNTKLPSNDSVRKPLSLQKAPSVESSSLMPPTPSDRNLRGSQLISVEKLRQSSKVLASITLEWSKRAEEYGASYRHIYSGNYPMPSSTQSLVNVRGQDLECQDKTEMSNFPGGSKNCLATRIVRSLDFERSVNESTMKLSLFENCENDEVENSASKTKMGIGKKSSQVPKCKDDQLEHSTMEAYKMNDLQRGSQEYQLTKICQKDQMEVENSSSPTKIDVAKHGSLECHLELNCKDDQLENLTSSTETNAAQQSMQKNHPPLNCEQQIKNLTFETGVTVAHQSSQDYQLTQICQKDQMEVENSASPTKMDVDKPGSHERHLELNCKDDQLENLTSSTETNAAQQSMQKKHPSLNCEQEIKNLTSETGVTVAHQSSQDYQLTQICQKDQMEVENSASPTKMDVDKPGSHERHLELNCKDDQLENLTSSTETNAAQQSMQKKHPSLNCEQEIKNLTSETGVTVAHQSSQDYQLTQICQKDQMEVENSASPTKMDVDKPGSHERHLELNCKDDQLENLTSSTETNAAQQSMQKKHPSLNCEQQIKNLTSETGVTVAHQSSQDYQLTQICQKDQMEVENSASPTKMDVDKHGSQEHHVELNCKDDQMENLTSSTDTNAAQQSMQKNHPPLNCEQQKKNLTSETGVSVAHQSSQDYQLTQICQKDQVEVKKLASPTKINVAKLGSHKRLLELNCKDDQLENLTSSSETNSAQQNMQKKQPPLNCENQIKNLTSETGFTVAHQSSQDYQLTQICQKDQMEVENSVAPTNMDVDKHGSQEHHVELNCKDDQMENLTSSTDTNAAQQSMQKNHLPLNCEQQKKNLTSETGVSVAHQSSQDYQLTQICQKDQVEVKKLASPTKINVAKLGSHKHLLELNCKDDQLENLTSSSETNSAQQNMQKKQPPLNCENQIKNLTSETGFTVAHQSSQDYQLTQICQKDQMEVENSVAPTNMDVDKHGSQEHHVELNCEDDQMENLTSSTEINFGQQGIKKKQLSLSCGEEQIKNLTSETGVNVAEHASPKYQLMEVCVEDQMEIVASETSTVITQQSHQELHLTQVCKEHQLKSANSESKTDVVQHVQKCHLMQLNVTSPGKAVNNVDEAIKHTFKTNNPKCSQTSLVPPVSDLIKELYKPLDTFKGEEKKLWAVEMLALDQCDFSFLGKTLNLIIKLEEVCHTDENIIIKNIKAISFKSDFSGPLGIGQSNSDVQLMHLLIKETTNLPKLIEKYPTTLTLPELLKRVSASVQRALVLSQDLAQVKMRNTFTTSGTDVKVLYVCSFLVLEFTVTLPINLKTYPLEKIVPKFEPSVGSFSDIQSEAEAKLESVKPGINYIWRMVRTINKILHAKREHLPEYQKKLQKHAF